MINFFNYSLLIYFLSINQAFAYLDPYTGSIILSFFASIFSLFILFFKKIKSFFSRFFLKSENDKKDRKNDPIE